MRNLKLFFLFFIVFNTSVHAQDLSDKWFNITTLSTNDSIITLLCSVDNYKITEVNTPLGVLNGIYLKGAPKIIERGKPELPRITGSVVIPNWQNAKISTVVTKKSSLSVRKIKPAVGNRKHGQKADDLAFGNIYRHNINFPEQIAEISQPFIFRKQRGISFEIFPMQYNPVENKLIVNKEIIVTISRIGEIEKEIASENNTTFEQIYSRQFINYSEKTKNKKRYIPIDESGGMLIIAPEIFQNELNSFVQWKKQSGIEIYRENTGDAPTTESIKSLITNYYQDKNISFCLLVGDDYHVPTVIKDLPDGEYNSRCDPALGYIDGDDYYPEVIVGRFSVDNAAQLARIIKKSIAYEKYNVADSNWLSNYTLVASDEGVGDDMEYDHEHMQNVRIDLDNYTYLSGQELYDGSQGGLDAAGNPTPDLLINAFNNGTGMVNYIGHGSYQQFTTTGFRSSHVAQFTNTDKWPFMFIVACESGDYSGKDCMSEELLRADYNGEPTGAVIVLGSSIAQDWDPPMSGHDEMIDILTGQYSENQKFSFGAIVANGCAKMNEEYPNIGHNNAMTWTIFGDPSLMIRTAEAMNINASLPSEINRGTKQINVKSDREDALITVLDGDDLLSKTKMTSGSILIDIPDNSGSVLTITISAYNAIPEIYTVNIISSLSYNFVINKYLIDDISENNNALPDFGESIYLTIELENNSLTDAALTEGILLCENEYIEIISPSATFDATPATGTVRNAMPFQIKIADNIPDGTFTIFNLSLKDANGNNQICYFDFTVNAPKPEFTILGISEKKGNGNPFFEQNEEQNLFVELRNNGNADAQKAVLSLTANSEFIDIENNTQTIDFPKNIVQILTFNLKTTPNAPVKEIVTFELNVTADAYTLPPTVFTLNINPQFEDWEIYSFERYDWQKTGDSEWDLTNIYANNGRYSAKSGSLNDYQFSSLTIEINVVRNDSISFYRKVSSETGFDFLTFYIDDVPQTRWSGEQDWQREVFPVSVGFHTFVWEYSNDQSETDGENTAWIDDIVFPKHGVSNNLPPVFISVPPDYQLYTGEIYSYNISANDPENDLLTISCTKKPDWLSFIPLDNGEALLWGTSGQQDIGNNDIELQVSDGINPAVAQQFSLSVIAGISENIRESFKVNLYPNPATDLIYLQIETDRQEQFLFDIFDISGRKISSSQQSVKEGVNIIPLPLNLNAGTYFFRIKNKKGVSLRQIFYVK